MSTDGLNTNSISPAFAIHRHLPHASMIIYGCMGLGGQWDDSPFLPAHIQQADALVHTALDSGINFFDHADIYTLGKAEQVFGEVLAKQPHLRDKIIVQSKCGIRFADNAAPKRYDLSYKWIMHSVEQSLKRLRTDHLDILLLHRPDPLMEPFEVAKAFDQLHQQGKVRFFGVSNMHRHQMVRLQQALDQKLIINQMEMHLAHTHLIDEELYAGHPQAASHQYSQGLINHCQQHHTQLQSWGSLSQGLFLQNSTALKNYIERGHTTHNIQATQQCVHMLAEKYNSTAEAILLAWLMRSPLNVTPVIGTTTPQRIQACAHAHALSLSLSLSREDWYRLYVTARGEELP